MAGIAGVLGNEHGNLDLMLERIRHRGPHETVRSDDGPVHLGCNELNIGGGCPDGSHYARDGRRSVVMDGRIYNEGLGAQTDAQATLELYDRHGSRFTERIDGDFACALSCDGSLLLARDESGINQTGISGLQASLHSRLWFFLSLYSFSARLLSSLSPHFQAPISGVPAVQPGRTARLRRRVY